MDRIEELKKMLEGLSTKAAEKMAKYLESLSEEDRKAWEGLMDAKKKVEKELEEEEAKIAEEEKKKNEEKALAEKNKTKVPDEKGKAKVPEGLRDVGRKISEESEKFLKDLREAVQLGTRFAGSLPTEMATAIQTNMEQLAGLYSKCTIHKASGDYVVVVESEVVTVSYTAESAAISETSPNLDPIKLSALKLAGLARISSEMLSDLAVDIMAWITTEFAKAFARQMEHEILLGLGTSSDKNKIRGIITNANKIVTAASATAITWEEVKKAVQAIGAYRTGATIVVSQQIHDQIHSFKDGSSYMFDQTRNVERIMGCPVVISDQMPAIAGGKAALVVGNFAYYHIADRQDVTIRVLEERYAEYDQVGIKATKRVDGDFVKEAFAVLNLKAGS